MVAKGNPENVFLIAGLSNAVPYLHSEHALLLVYGGGDVEHGEDRIKLLLAWDSVREVTVCHDVGSGVGCKVVDWDSWDGAIYNNTMK